MASSSSSEQVTSNAYVLWPEADTQYLVEDTIEMGVQINGKTRGSIKVALDATEDVAMRLAKSEPSVEKFLDGKEIKKVIYKAGKILNIVVPK